MTQKEFNFIKDAFSQIIDDIGGNPDWHEAAEAVAADLGVLERQLESKITTSQQASDESPVEQTQDIKTEIEQLISNCNTLIKEVEEQKRCTNFLIDKYKTNKRWFREDPGKVTIDDVIKTCFEFGWSSKRNFDYNK